MGGEPPKNQVYYSIVQLDVPLLQCPPTVRQNNSTNQTTASIPNLLSCCRISRRPLHSRTPDLTRSRTGEAVELGVCPHLDIRLKSAPGLTCCRGRFWKFAAVSHFLMNHENTKSLRAATTAPLCFRAFVVERICGRFIGERKGATPRQCWIVFATVSEIEAHKIIWKRGI